jgi:hypothetical protein
MIICFFFKYTRLPEHWSHSREGINKPLLPLTVPGTANVRRNCLLQQSSVAMQEGITPCVLPSPPLLSGEA